MAGKKIKERLFITGAYGFIGTNLREFFSPTYEIFIPRRTDLDLFDEHAIRRYIKKNKIDYIIHCANKGGGRDTIGIIDVVHTNLRMFFNIVRNAYLVKKIIHFGSGAEYDKSKPIIKAKEEEVLRQIPKDDYGFYKYVCSQYIEAQKNIVCLRLFGVYGHHEDYRYKFISNAIIKNLLKLPIAINQNVNFDYMHIEDLMKIVAYMLKHKTDYRIYNASHGKTIDLITISKIINEISDHPSEIFLKNKGLNNEYTSSNTRLKKEMKNFIFTNYKEGIQKLYEYYKKHIKDIDVKEILEDKFIQYCTMKVS